MTTKSIFGIWKILKLPLTTSTITNLLSWNKKKLRADLLLLSARGGEVQNKATTLELFKWFSFL